GDVVVTGFSADANTYEDCYTAVYASSDDTLIWERRYSGSGGSDFYPTGLAVDARGNVIVTGFASLRRDGLPNYFTLKYSAEGQELWEKEYDGPGHKYDRAAGLVVDNYGDIIVAGTSDNESGDSDF